MLIKVKSKRWFQILYLNLIELILNNAKFNIGQQYFYGLFRLVFLP